MTAEESIPQLVVVGASSGGIEALSVLVSTLPPDFAAPMVIAQHLDPARPSHLEEILGRRSTLPVRTVTERERLEGGVVYVVPADRHVVVVDGEVSAQPDGRGGRPGPDGGEAERGEGEEDGGGGRVPAPSVDRLLRSAAAAYGEGLIAVILTGLGTDGAAGAHDVRQAGGTVIIQNPDTARFPAMPQSVAPATVDIAADLETIGPLLHELLTGPQRITVPDEDRRLQGVLTQLRERNGIDFSGYKLPTILRRLQRRMVATDTHRLAEYQRYLQRHPEEYQRLASSFLIKVTGFFRDPALFDFLREQVLPELIEDAAERGGELRLWSAGCATGEEAYSLAILVAEVLGDRLERFNVRVFATDLDTSAVAFARRGVYPASALAEAPPALVERYFTALDGEYTIRKQVRALTVFGHHDLGQRAPFPRIDLALCRNVLIYFTPELQRRALQLFAFALRSGGYLALGKAETTTPLAELFSVAESRLKVYRRQSGRPVAIPAARIRDVAPLAPPRGLPPPAPEGAGMPHVARAPGPADRPLPAAARGLRTAFRSRRPADRSMSLLLHLPIGVVVVDRRYDIQTINGEARRLLGIHATAVGDDLIHLLRDVSPAAVRGAVDAALREAVAGEAPSGEPARVLVETTGSGGRAVQIACYPHGSESDGESLALVLVSDVTARVQATRELEGALAGAQAALQGVETRHREELDGLQGRLQDLAETNRQLLEANGELVEANAELLNENEELLAGQEEAEAATEEVETLNEELQATNEEQETLNEELQATVEELNTTNGDLEARSEELQELTASLAGQQSQLRAVLGSMGDAVLVLGPTGDRVLTNAAYDRQFGGQNAVLAPEDADGQPVPPEATFAARARRGETFMLPFTLTAADGTRRWLEANGQPVRDASDMLGSVITIRDVTERSLRRLQEEFIAIASHELRTPLAALGTYVQLIARQRPPDGERGRGADGERDDAGAADGQQSPGELALAQLRRLNRLVGDLVEVARLESGGLHLALGSIDLVRLTRRVVEAVQPLTRGQTIRLDASAVPDGGLLVTGDALRLEQVLTNLLTNAIAYAPGTATIDVRLGRAAEASPGADGDGAGSGGPAGRAADEMAVVEVQDSGPGIAPADLGRIFTRFYRTEQGEGASGDGLGLGLYIAREIVVAHGGTIDADSAAGRGSTFTVRLPLVAVAGRAADSGRGDAGA